jgi:hypothetical protein
MVSPACRNSVMNDAKGENIRDSFRVDAVHAVDREWMLRLPPWSPFPARGASAVNRRGVSRTAAEYQDASEGRAERTKAWRMFAL